MEIFELLPFPPHSLSSLTLMTIKMEEAPLPSADNTIPLFLSSPQFLWRPDASANFNCFSVRSQSGFMNFAFAIQASRRSEGRRGGGRAALDGLVDNTGRGSSAARERREVRNYGT